jgi:hypothetical protein
MRGTAERSKTEKEQGAERKKKNLRGSTPGAVVD